MKDALLDTHSGKFHAAQTAAALVAEGMNVGLGSGSTAELVVQALGRRVASEGLQFVGVATSLATAELARSLRITLAELDDVDRLDLNIDGADEIDPSFRMIKGRGGALLREKIVASFARRRVTVVTPEKRVTRLGMSSPLPVEVSPIGVRHLVQKLSDMGEGAQVRLQPDGSHFVTDGGNKIIDCRFRRIEDPARLDGSLHQIVGVFETGLFIGLCDLLIVGADDRVEQVDCGVQAG